MSQETLAHGPQLEQAVAVLTGATQLIDRALDALKARCSEGGKLSPAKLDDQQLASYELSVSWAECTAARFLLAHAQRLATQDPAENSFTAHLAALFCAEAVTNTLHRLRTRPADFGLQLAQIAAVEQQAGVASFLSQQLLASNIAKLGEAVLDRDGNLGPDLLSEHHSMMRDTFRRFSDDVVAPLAESVHREDLIIPDAILEPLKDMGMFGLSIPASYGGLQEDDREDTLEIGRAHV